MFRYNLVILFSFLLTRFSAAQAFKSDSVKLFLNKSIAVIESNSINTENIESIKSMLYNRSSNLSTIDEVVPLFEEVFKSLNDYHGAIKYKGKTYGWTKTSSYNNLLIDQTLLERKSRLNYPDKAHIPIVILISGYTASAGEMTAISFIGRANVYLVGEPTANYTTAVQGFEIGKSAAINLSTDYVIDRNHKIYRDGIIPDFEIQNGDNFEDILKDAKISKALKLFKIRKYWVH